jgi:amidase
LNPLNLSWTAGGSSGGESALIALKGSCLGVGTDIAGSVRIPAAYCGVYGFKPSANRVPYAGQTNPRDTAIPGIVASAGPIARSLDDIELFMESVTNANPWKYDVEAHPGPWSRVTGLGSGILTVGVMFESHQFPLHPPVRRALDEAARKLQHAGHRVVHLPQDSKMGASYACRLSSQFFDVQNYGTVDPLKESGEPMVPSVAIRSTPIVTGPLLVSDSLNIADRIIALNHLRHDFCERWRKVWIQYGLDVVISPASQSTTVQHDKFGWPPYTVLWNLPDVSVFFFHSKPPS